jgi:hypothetical protein
MGRDSEGVGEAGGAGVFAFIGPCRRPGVGRRPSGWCDRRECCEGEMQKDRQGGRGESRPNGRRGRPVLAARA